MYKVLVFGMTENPGGVESFLMNNYRMIDKKSISFDFLCNTTKKIAYEDELIRSGSKIFHIFPRRKNPFRFYKELNTFFRNNASDYDCVWVNLNTLVNVEYLKIAKRYGIKRRIVHSHNSRNMDTGIKGKITYLFHLKHKKNIADYATDYWACSSLAARWFYPQDILSEVQIIKNGINIESVSFNETKRKEIRKKLDIMDNTLVLGNVGRLHFQKNQQFALAILNELVNCNHHKDIKLILVGQGPDEKILRKKVDELKLNKNVIFAGVQKDIQSWLSAFDIFLFPSLFEGLGIAGLEAEANGLPVLAASNEIPEELKINNNFYFMDLNSNVKKWANKVQRIPLQRENKNIINKNFQNSGYKIEESVKKITSLFLENNE